MSVQSGTADIRTIHGAPGDGTTAVQTLDIATGTPTSGTYRLKFRGFSTSALAHDASAAAVQAALRALRSIGSTGVTVADTLGDFPYTLTFGGPLEKNVVPLVVADNANLVGGTMAVTEDTPGVAATARGAKPAAILQDVDNGVAYINTGTVTAPVWKSITHA